MRKYVDGVYMDMTPEEIAFADEMYELYGKAAEQATEADYQQALRQMGVDV